MYTWGYEGTAALDLEALELGQGAVQVEDGVPTQRAVARMNI